MKVDNTIIHLDGVRDHLWVMLASLILFVVLLVFALRDSDIKNGTYRQKRPVYKAIGAIIALLGIVGYVAYANMKPQIAVL